MSISARLGLLSFICLLAACSSQAPLVTAPISVEISSSAEHFAGDEVLLNAIGLVGTPYRYGGNTPESGFDCSGLIGYVYRNAAGLSLPRSTREMIRMTAPDVPRHELSSGDLVFFATNGGRQVSHAGIYVGDGRFVHAPSSGGTVRLEQMDLQYWQRAYLGAKRVLSAPSLAQQD